MVLSQPKQPFIMVQSNKVVEEYGETRCGADTDEVESLHGEKDNNYMINNQIPTRLVTEAHLQKFFQCNSFDKEKVQLIPSSTTTASNNSGMIVPRKEGDSIFDSIRVDETFLKELNIQFPQVLTRCLYNGGKYVNFFEKVLQSLGSPDCTSSQTKWKLANPTNFQLDLEKQACLGIENAMLAGKVEYTIKCKLDLKNSKLQTSISFRFRFNIPTGCIAFDSCLHQQQNNRQEANLICDRNDTMGISRQLVSRCPFLREEAIREEHANYEELEYIPSIFKFVDKAVLAIFTGNLDSYFASVNQDTTLDDRVEILEEIPHLRHETYKQQQKYEGPACHKRSSTRNKFHSIKTNSNKLSNIVSGTLPLKSLSEEEVTVLLSKIFQGEIMTIDHLTGEQFYQVSSISELADLGINLPPMKLQKLFRILKEYRLHGVPNDMIEK